MDPGPRLQFTLTCISTGRPVTTVTWTRDGEILTEGDKTSTIVDTSSAKYIHTLTMTKRQAGVYRCLVEINDQPSGSSSLVVKGLIHYSLRLLFCPLVASAPTNLTVEVQSDYTTVLLRWIPPNPLGNTTGYRIFYTGGGSENVSGGSTNNTALSVLKRGEVYNISIVGTSEHLFSESIWRVVTLTG